MFVRPGYTKSWGPATLDLVRLAGRDLDEWQQLAINEALGVDDRGKFTAFEVAGVVSRQNGKGDILLARALAGLFLLDERLILHSAHELKTAKEGFTRLADTIMSTPALAKRVGKIMNAHNEEGIRLKDGRRILFVARTKGSGRGFTADCVILDEAYKLGPEAVAALMPTLSTRPNPQVWYTSSAGLPDSTQLGSVRRRAVRGEKADSLLYMEWSARPDADLDDPQAWADGNPALGYRLDDEFIERERQAMDDDMFARERLSIWDEGDTDGALPLETWLARKDKSSQVLEPICFSVDINPGRTTTAIGLAGVREDSLRHVELVDHGPGTEWPLSRLIQLNQAWKPIGVVIDPGSAAATLIKPLTDAGVNVISMTPRNVAAACSSLHDMVINDELRHVAQDQLAAAIANAVRRPLAGAWAWDRKTPASDITPLVAVTNALWGWTNRHADQAARPNIW